METLGAESRRPDTSGPNGRHGAVALGRELSSTDGDARGEARAGLRSALHEQLLAAISQDRIEGLSDLELRRELLRLSETVIHDHLGSPDFPDQEAVVNEVLDEILGYGPLGSLMRQVDISEILVNGPHQVFIELHGQLQHSDVMFRDEDHLVRVIHKLMARTTRRLDRKAPMVDARLPDGSRLNVVLKPPALNGPLVSIRRFGSRPLTVDDLLAKDSLAREMLDFLAACVMARVNIVIAGGTGCGKTTLLGGLSRFIPGTERLVTIEDTAELELQQPHLAKMESQPADENGEGAVTIRDLTRNALRMRPDRIVVGECRGAEALEMLQAMNTGHEGSMTTVHANAPREALSRIELMVSMGGVELPVSAIRKLIAASIQLVVQIARLPDGKRKVVAISEITGMEGDTVSMHDLFNFVQTGTAPDGGVEGYFHATGIRPRLLNRLNVRGANLPFDIFSERRLEFPSRRRTVR
jgi:pilus assembly protein CpaF